MFERFTDRARRVVTLSQEEARLLNHGHIGTEHILLGLLNEGEGIAAEALTSLGVELTGIRQEVVQVIGHGEGSPPEHIPFTPRAKKVLEHALRESIGLGHHYIGTEHMLLGLIRERDGVAAQVLVSRGLDLGTVRQRVVELLGVTETGGWRPIERDLPVGTPLRTVRRYGTTRLALIGLGVIVASLLAADADDPWITAGLVLLGLALLGYTVQYIADAGRSRSRGLTHWLDLGATVVFAAAALVFMIGAVAT